LGECASKRATLLHFDAQKEYGHGKRSAEERMSKKNSAFEIDPSPNCHRMVRVLSTGRDRVTGFADGELTCCWKWREKSVKKILLAGIAD
jgi:hypothetical protein